MSAAEEFRPIDRAAWTRGAVRSSAVLFTGLVLLALVAAALGRAWWLTAAGAAVIVAVVAPIAIVRWRRATDGRSVLVTDDAVVLRTSRSREIIVRRGAADHAAVLAPVLRGPGSPSSSTTLLIVGGGQIIRLTDEAWEVSTLREIASRIGVDETHDVLTRSQLERAVGHG